MNMIHKMARAMKRMLYLSALSMAMMALCAVNAFAQDNWILEIHPNQCAEKLFYGYVDGVYTSATADNYPWIKIESTTGVISGTASSNTTEYYDCSYCAILDDQIICDANQQNCYRPCLVWQEQTCPNVLCSTERSVSLSGQTCLENTIDDITVRLYKGIAPPSAGHGCGGVNLSTISPSSTYTWEVTDNPDISGNWKVVKTTATSSANIQPSELSTLGLNLSGPLYARVKDPSCQWRVSTQSNSFQIYYPAPTFTLTPQGPDCNGGNDGKITISVPSGGLSKYSVTLYYNNDVDPVYQRLEMPVGNFPFIIDESQHNLTSGSWKVVVQNADDPDNRGDCETPVTTIVPVTQKLAGSKTADAPVRCFGENNGSVTLAVANGTAGFAYTVDAAAKLPAIGSAVRAPIFTGLSGGTHAIIITDVNNCVSESIEILIQTPTTLLTPSIAIDKAISCFEKNDGILIASATGGVPGYSYLWSNSSTNQTISGLAAITYTVDVTDAYGCKKSASETLTRPTTSRLDFEFSIVKNISCADKDDGILGVINVVKNQGEVYYDWSTNEDTETIQVGDGTYSLTISDDAGCTSVAKSQALADPPAYTVSIVELSDHYGKPISCKGENDGELGAIVRDGNGDLASPQNYTWNRGVEVVDAGVSINSIQGLIAGNYKVTIDYGSSCTAEDTHDLFDPAPVDPLITISSTSLHNGFHISCPGEDDGSLHAAGSGGTPKTAPDPPYSFQWENGPAGADLTGKVAGTYKVIATDANGCTGEKTATLVDPPPINPTIDFALLHNGLHVSCRDEDDGKLDAITTGGAAPLSYSWSRGDTGPQLSNVAPGNYTVTVTDDNGCSMTSPLKTVINPAPVIASISVFSDYHGQAISCFNATDGSLKASGTGGTNSFTYSWSTGAKGIDLSGIPSGTYTLTATDMNGCADNDAVTLINPEPVKAVISDFSNYNSYGVHCKGDNDGFIEAEGEGGTNSFTFFWTETAEATFRTTDLVAGTYHVKVTDTNGCWDNTSYEITEPDLLTLSLAGKKDILCYDGDDGELTVLPGGGASGYEYSINTTDWQNDPQFTGLKAIGYTVIVQDINGCSESITETLTQPDELSISFTIEPAFCADPRGAATAEVTGGVAGYTYEWRDNTNALLSTTSSIANRAAGLYTLLIHDDNSCPLTEIVGIPSTDGPQVNVKEVVSAKCSYSSDGSGLLEVTAGDAPFRFLWPDGQTTIQGIDLPKGVYQVTITDVNECATVTPVDIPAPEELDISAIETTMPACNGDCNGKIKVASTGGSGAHTYVWNSQSGEEAKNLCAGSHSVVVKDANNCTTTESFQLIEPEILQLQLVGRTLPLCNGSCDGNIQVEASGGNGGYQFVWSSGSNAALADNICAGEHTVTVKDNKNCIVERIIPLGEPTQLEVRLLKNQSPICHNGCDGELEVQAYGGTGSYHYSWVTGSTTAGLVSLCPEEYNVTINDDNACFISETYTIENPPALAIDLGGSITLCVGQTHALDAGTLWTKYTWGSNTGFTGNTSKVTIKDAGQYWVELVNRDNCIAQDTFLLETSTNLLQAKLMLPTEGIVGDTVVMIDISWPLPESITWEYPTAMRKLLDLGEIIHGQFDEPGIYEIKLTARLGECFDDMSKTISILRGEDEPDGGRLGREEFVKGFTLYPNPTDGNFDVSVELAEESQITLSVWNGGTSLFVGRVIESGKQHYLTHFSLRQLGSGTYILRLDHKKGKEYIRFIVH